MLDTNLTVSVLVGQLPAFVAFLKQWDPDGTYVLRSRADGEVQRFEAVYFAPSDHQKFALGCRPVMSSDGAHLKSEVGGVMMNNCVKDANEQPTVVAMALVRVENGFAWRFLLEQGMADFPNAALVVNDAAKGGISAAAALDLERQTCLRHIAENLKSSKVFGEALGSAVKPILYMAAKAATKASFESALALLYVLEDLRSFAQTKLQAVRFKSLIFGVRFLLTFFVAGRGVPSSPRTGVCVLLAD